MRGNKAKPSLNFSIFRGDTTRRVSTLKNFLIENMQRSITTLDFSLPSSPRRKNKARCKLDKAREYFRWETYDLYASEKSGAQRSITTHILCFYIQLYFKFVA